MADIKISENLTKNQIFLLNYESFLNELQTHEIIFIEGGGGYYRDCGYANGCHDYGYTNGCYNYGYANGCHDYGYGNYEGNAFYGGGSYFRRV
ncbi:hypothetical protein [Nostoc sp. PA-18-2419]|uniref:hypothetical protein n=1 Tax=Nostoc sp. PA-18-2419 TaxID=2575443 RepID=UPI001107E9EE|nr:hypothetical protein [Nostoc sp. PA-18-2419]